MAQNMRGNADGQVHRGNFVGGGFTSDRWVAIIVLGSIGLLVLIRMGFRGVGFMGARVSVT